MKEFIWGFCLYFVEEANRNGISVSQVADIVTKAGAFLGLILAIVAYRTNNRIKASELLISLEREYKEHIKIVTEIEFMEIYDSKYKPYLEKDPKDLKPEDIAIGIQLESAIRYFYLCSKIGKLGVTNGHIQFMSAYYLKVFVYETKKGTSWLVNLNPYIKDKYKRPELRNYMYKYWHGVYFWAPHARRPWPARIFIYIRQIPFRLGFWFKSLYD